MFEQLTLAETKVHKRKQNKLVQFNKEQKHLERYL